MSDQEELKKLMQERRKQKLQQQQLPQNAQLINGQLICIECQQINQNLIEFQRHLQSQKHKDALQVLKRNAQIDISRLENEAYREQKIKKQRLTKEQIEKINKEVDLEFAEIEQIQQNNENQIPEDFFDQIETETKIQKQLQEEHQKKIQQIDEQKEDNEINVENEKQELQKLREKIKQQRQQKIQQNEFDYFMDNQNDDDGFNLNWKQKGEK